MRVKKQYPLLMVVACAVFICTLLIFYLQSINSIKKVQEHQNQQDFTLILQGEEITDLSNKYSFTYDPVTYKVIYDGRNVYRIMHNKRNIDIPLYSEGVAPQKTTEIAIDKNFAQENKLTLGDPVTIGNTAYSISGIFTLPDAISPLVADNGVGYKPSTQALILCSEEAYSSWGEQEKTGYSGRFLESVSEEQKQIFLEKMLMDSNVKSVVSKEDNPQVLATLIAKEKMFKICLISALSFLGLTVMVLLIITVIQNITETKSTMGVLKALGYSRIQIAKRYFLIGPFLFIGAVVGYLASYAVSPLFIKRINATFLVPNVTQNFDPVQFIMFTTIPALFFSVMAFGIVVFALRKPPLEMIHNSESVKLNFLVKRMGKNKSTNFKKAVFKAIVLNNILLVFLALLTGFMASANLQIAFSLQTMSDKVSSLTLKGSEYESNVRFIEAKDMKFLDSETPYFSEDCKVEFPNGGVLNNGQFMALSSSLSLFKLYSIKNQEIIDISKQEGIVVNDWMRKKYDLSIGDTVKIHINNVVYQLPITAIEQSVYGEVVYSNIDVAINAGLLEKEEYNGVFSEDNVEFDSKQHMFVSKLEDVIYSSSQQKGTYFALSFLFIAIGLALSIITISIVLKIIISSNRKYLAMMKAFGYTNSECNRIVLSGFRIIAYIGFIIGTLYAIVLTKFLFDLLAKASTVAIPMTPDSKVIALSLVIFAVSYEVIMLLYKKSMNAVSLQEVMMK
ncbi:FtsX-like permease family protein [Lysinibacillus sp. NPDC094177]|uniref:FtsX-like permease family protein n=1 Tax=Lysinibacillus sp. NPDC094177 TaxID=3390580 RepID=UPI003CFE0011